MSLFISTLAIMIFLFMAQGAAAQGKRVRNTRTTRKIISCGICNQEAIFLPKPMYAAAAAVNISGSVGVEILIDTDGNVIEAKVASGHPLLRAASVNAAQKAKFTPKLLSGIPVMVRGLIVYNFSSRRSRNPRENAATYILVVNGRATSLPKPEHSQEAKDRCADGKVEIELLIGEDGTVMQATAISGEDLLVESALDAARRATFQTHQGPPIKTRGILAYNFFLENKCVVDAGVVNKKAVSMPKPVINAPAIIERQTEIEVRVVIDESGTVVAAKAVKGHPLIRKALENAARKARFLPILINPGPLKVKGVIVYKINTDRSVEF